MISDLEIWRAAQATIDQHGDGAALHAAQRADELMADGDMDGRAVWHRIERAIDELRKTAPGHGEGVHLCRRYGPAHDGDAPRCWRASKASAWAGSRSGLDLGHLHEPTT